MILVDTSVWVRFLAGREPHKSDMLYMLAYYNVAGHDLIYGELLMSDVISRKEVLRDYELMHRAPLLPHREVAAFVRKHRLNGRGVGWTDAHLLASAVASNMQFWTADPRLAAIAQELGVDFRIEAFFASGR